MMTRLHDKLVPFGAINALITYLKAMTKYNYSYLTANKGTFPNKRTFLAGDDSKSQSQGHHPRSARFWGLFDYPSADT